MVLVLLKASSVNQGHYWGYFQECGWLKGSCITCYHHEVHLVWWSLVFPAQLAGSSTKDTLPSAIVAAHRELLLIGEGPWESSGSLGCLVTPTTSLSTREIAKQAGFDEGIFCPYWLQSSTAISEVVLGGTRPQRGSRPGPITNPMSDSRWVR